MELTRMPRTGTDPHFPLKETRRKARLFLQKDPPKTLILRQLATEIVTGEMEWEK